MKGKERDCPKCGGIKTLALHNADWNCHKCGYCEIEPEAARCAAETIVRYFNRHWLDWTDESRVAEAERVIQLTLDRALEIQAGELASPDLGALEGILQRWRKQLNHITFLELTVQDIESALTALRQVKPQQQEKDTQRVDWLEKQVFTNREGVKEIHYDFSGPLRDAIDRTMGPQADQRKSLDAA